MKTTPTLKNHVLPMFVPYSALIRPSLGQSGLKIYLFVKLPIKTRNKFN